jgi:hypothetical protein
VALAVEEKFMVRRQLEGFSSELVKVIIHIYLPLRACSVTFWTGQESRHPVR